MTAEKISCVAGSIDKFLSVDLADALKLSEYCPRFSELTELGVVSSSRGLLPSGSSWAGFKCPIGIDVSQSIQMFAARRISRCA